jgi:hypothetical protein
VLGGRRNCIMFLVAGRPFIGNWQLAISNEQLAMNRGSGLRGTRLMFIDIDGYGWILIDYLLLRLFRTCAWGFSLRESEGAGGN